MEAFASGWSRFSRLFYWAVYLDTTMGTIHTYLEERELINGDVSINGNDALMPVIIKQLENGAILVQQYTKDQPLRSKGAKYRLVKTS